MLTTTSQPSFGTERSGPYARDMLSRDPDADADYGLVSAPPLPPSITCLFGSVKHGGRFSVPVQLQLKAAFGELKLDLREALFPDKHIYVVAESLCAAVEVLLPEGVDLKIDKQTHLTLTGYDKQMLGQVAANIRSLRPPDPYKNKGIRYTGEVLRKKVGKTGAGGAGAK